MRSDLNIACIIPARGGSKGIPNKNIYNVGGLPLIAWSIKQAKATKSLENSVYVSSDSEEILNVSIKYGANGIKRPDELSGDKASSEVALLHALDEMEKIEGKLDYIVFLQATSPLRSFEDIENALEKIIETEADSLLSVHAINDFFIWDKKEDSFVSENFDYKNRKRRQDIPVKYLENGSIYIFKPHILKEQNNRLGGKIEVYEMDKIHSIQIDNIDEMELAEYFLRRYYV
jgi:N-acylneuraminate cytidylyltransferase